MDFRHLAARRYSTTLPEFLYPDLPEGKRFLKLDEAADRPTNGPLWLANSAIAQIVQEQIIKLAGHLYELAAWVIMANHVHIVILPKIPLPKIMQKLKESTACAANRILGRTGQPFWAIESYDHWIRSNNELNSVISYVERNPVKAGLVDAIEQWPWSSATTAQDTD